MNNIHASALVLGTKDGPKGILLTGLSGSGKSSLALYLIRQRQREGLFAALIGDDQVFVSTRNKRNIVRPASTISGKVELRGYGIVTEPFEEASTIEHVFELVVSDQMERLAVPTQTTIGGVEYDVIQLPCDDFERSAEIVFSTINAEHVLNN